MLKSLFISNYAIIKELEIDFFTGLTTITGETGAGKSILLGALSLILGQRADTSVLLDKEQKCVVEGTFENSEELIVNILNENDLDPEKHLIIRREISPGGKSRAFVNDTPVNLNVLRDLGERLVDIHSQHENLDLNNKLYQLTVVDAFAGLEKELSEYKTLWESWGFLQKELRQLKESAGKNKAELDFLQFQYKELEEAKLKEDEKAELEEELELLSHAEEIKTGLFSVYQLLNEDEFNVVSLLKDCENQLVKLKDFHKTSAELYSRLESVLIELRDIAAETEQTGETIELDPKRLEYVRERLDLIYKLEQKHSVDSVEALISLKKTLDNRISELSDSEFRIPELEKQLSAETEKLGATAKNLSIKRQKAIPEIEKRITDLLIQLGIPNARFKIENSNNMHPGEYGVDEISFLFTANKKSGLQEISKVASGGELSRLMLSIKYIISHSTGLPTIIFDEIDTGVSGEIAHKVAGIMREMSMDHQVLTITHLPQVASGGDRHFLVYKNDHDDGMHTGIRILNDEERLREIAKMLSGKQTTEAALANARDLLKERT